ncbi:GAF domain-containing sensor histidine kinase [Streptomyces iconiensis]|uniref:GAF domain-containing protein n=1 Tax=Streptomyces iconiensis TaxID=1384038 RepID=A0ABT7A2D3_9ACTN|nr:GAF domain-containing protein [Streptomyces iconiensis]MDJ1135499.1 GAF domain-containing protein [Streptomyces iconiensis]
MESGAGDGGAAVPRLRLDELLEELERRIGEVRGTQDRLHGLLEAVLSIGRGLDVSQVLKQIVEAAVVLVDAEYGALGVVAKAGEDRGLSAFLTVGLGPEQVAEIGELPRGHGILGELIRHPEPLRLPELSQHPASYGFPPGHPPMHSFLGVPVRVRDEVFGNFYLTEKRSAKEFDAEDEAVLATLAVAAGVAIENAQLYEEARQREQWASAGAEVIGALLSGAPRGEVLELIVERARGVVSADLAAVVLPVEGADGLRMGLADGVGAEAFRALAPRWHDGFIDEAFTAEGPVATADIQNDPRVQESDGTWSGLGPAVAVPMGAGEEARGVLVLARAERGVPFAEPEIAPALGFAAQVALAMEVAERRRDVEALALLEERDRIAKDLHDLAIQRLFATGMTLQSAQRLSERPELSERLGRAVKELDITIKIIRSTIFGLQAPETEGEKAGLRARTAETVEEAAAMLGFTPALRVEGLVDTSVPLPFADQVVAVLKEALSNAARHAEASAVDVHLAAGGGELTLTVTDNGRGLPEQPRRSGLRNLAGRAERLGGSMELETPVEGGTRLCWRVPLPGAGGTVARQDGTEP